MSSLFGQATWNVTDDFSLTGGVRGTREQKNTVVDRLAPTGPNPGIAALLPAYYSGDLERTDDTVSGLLSASWKLNNDTLLYASASRGAGAGASCSVMCTSGCFAA
jgi:iron complex outermembrane receptor protein